MSFTIRRCPNCGHRIHIHKKADGYLIKNVCKCISYIEIHDYTEPNGVTDEKYTWKVFSDEELEEFFKDLYAFWCKSPPQPQSSQMEMAIDA